LGGGTGSGLLASTSSSLQITGADLILGSTVYENPSHAYNISEVAINLDFNAGVITQAIIGGLVGGANTEYFGVNDFRLTLIDGGNTFSFFGYTVDTGTFGQGPGWNTTSGTSSLSAVPIPAAVWLFGSGLLGLVGMARRKQSA